MLPHGVPRPPRSALAATALGGAAIALAGCGGGTTTTVVVVQQPPTTTTAAPTPTVPAVTATVATPTVATVATTPTVASPATRTRSRRSRQLEASAEKTLRNFYAALRNRNVSAVCSLLTTGTVARFGGRANCKNGRYVRSAAASQAPPSNAGLRLTTLLANGDSRATILATKAGRRYVARLARQGGQWRVVGARRLSRR